jgi:hypothetical protein
MVDKEWALDTLNRFKCLEPDIYQKQKCNRIELSCNILRANDWEHYFDDGYFCKHTPEELKSLIESKLRDYVKKV